MVLEVAVLNIKSGKENEFEASFSVAQEIISSMHGYKWHQLQKCVETTNRYILLVQWASIEDPLALVCNERLTWFCDYIAK